MLKLRHAHAVMMNYNPGKKPERYYLENVPPPHSTPMTFYILCEPTNLFM